MVSWRRYFARVACVVWVSSIYHSFRSTCRWGPNKAPPPSLRCLYREFHLSIMNKVRAQDQQRINEFSRNNVRCCPFPNGCRAVWQTSWSSIGRGVLLFFYLYFAWEVTRVWLRGHIFGPLVVHLQLSPPPFLLSPPHCGVIDALGCVLPSLHYT